MQGKTLKTLKSSCALRAGKAAKFLGRLGKNIAASVEKHASAPAAGPASAYPGTTLVNSVLTPYLAAHWWTPSSTLNRQNVDPVSE